MNDDARRTDHLRAEMGPENEGIPDTIEGDPPQKQSIGEPEEGIILPGDRPKGSTQWGTTAVEQAHGEPHTQRLAREEWDQSDEIRETADRIADAPAGDGQAAGAESGDASGLSAEEEAVRETSEPELR